MDERNISNAGIYKINSEEQFNNLKKYGKIDIDLKKYYYHEARVQKGKWIGPDYYFLLRYSQPCPKGCCYDNVHEVLSADELKIELKKKMRELATYLSFINKRGK